MKFLIYGLVDPRNDRLRYVGQSSTGMRRPKAHLLRSSSTGTTHCARWLRQLRLVELQPRIIVLQSVTTAEMLDHFEQTWIAYAKSVGAPLTNLTAGGGGLRGWKASVETRAKLSAARLGNRNAVGNTSRRGKSASPETRARISASLIGSRRHVVPHTLTSKIKMSRSHGGAPIVDQYGVIYPTQIEAAKRLGLSFPNICHVLKGRRRHAGGYIFQFVDAR